MSGSPLRDLEERLLRFDGAPCRTWLPAALARALDADAAVTYRASPGPSHPVVDFAHFHGLDARLARRGLATFLRSVPPALVRRALRPSPRARNRVRIARRDRGRSAHDRHPITRELFPKLGLAGADVLRVVACHGPEPLACVGLFRRGRFREPDRRALEAVVPALVARFAWERRAEAAALDRASLEAALESLPSAAWLVDEHGRVRHANAAGRAGPPPAAALASPSVRIDVRGLPAHRLVVAGRSAARDFRDALTRRQRDVLAGVLAGRSNKQIAAALGCAESTVELHMTALLRRSGTRSRTELVARLLRGG